MTAENHSGEFEKLVKELQVKGNCHFPEEWRGIFLLFFEAGAKHALVNLQLPDDEKTTQFAVNSRSICPACGEETWWHVFFEGAVWMRDEIRRLNGMGEK